MGYNICTCLIRKLENVSFLKKIVILRRLIQSIRLILDDIKYRLMIHNEKKHYSKLLHNQEKETDKIQKLEPKIDAFAEAYKMYHPFFKQHMNNWDLEKYILDIAKTKSKIKILSLGSGTGDWEVDLLETEPSKIECELVDINDELLKGVKKYAKNHNLNIVTNSYDVNKIKLEENMYDFVIVRSSLHHFIELEHIFSEINKSLVEGGDLIVMGEVIGRNGEQLYPETKVTAQKIFNMLPEKFRYNTYTKNIDTEIPDIDHSKNAFESIRSEDILPLLLKFFKPKEYVTFDAFLSLLLDFRYGPNYDMSMPLDRSLVETITYLDMYYVSNSILKPTCLFGIFSKNPVTLS